MEYLQWLSSLGDLKTFFAILSISLAIVFGIFLIAFLMEIDGRKQDYIIQLRCMIISFILTILSGFMWGIIPKYPIAAPIEAKEAQIKTDTTKYKDHVTTN